MEVLLFFLFFGIVQGFCIALILALKYKSQITSSRFLIILLLISSGYLIFEYFVIYERLLVKLPHFTGAYLPFLYSIPPLFFLFVKFETDKSSKLTSLLFLHAIPAVIIFIMMIPYYLRPAAEKRETFYNHSEAYQLYPNAKLFAGILILMGIVYAVKSVLLFRRKQFHSQKSKWIRNYAVFFLVLLIIITLFQITIVLTHSHSNNIMAIALLIFSFFIHFIGYSMMSTTTILRGSIENSKIHLDNTKKDTLKTQLESLLIDEKVYTNSKLTLDDFCEKLDINKKYLSNFINQEFDCSFTTLINNYRVNDAKAMLKDKTYNHLNFSGIAGLVGFNDKNSFTRVFKRHTGLTPSEFRSNG